MTSKELRAIHKARKDAELILKEITFYVIRGRSAESEAEHDFDLQTAYAKLYDLQSHVLDMILD